MPIIKCILLWDMEEVSTIIHTIILSVSLPKMWSTLQEKNDDDDGDGGDVSALKWGTGPRHWMHDIGLWDILSVSAVMTVINQSLWRQDTS